MAAKYTKQQHLGIDRAGWDEGHRHLAERRRADPDWLGSFRDGGTTFTDREMELLGDVSGQDVLQLSCGGASQAFSFANIGANVTACYFSTVAIEEAKQNAERVGLSVSRRSRSRRSAPLLPIATAVERFLLKTKGQSSKQLSRSGRPGHMIWR